MTDPDQTRTAQPRPARKHGLRHLFAAARFSAAGLGRMLGETAFRHEVLAGLGVAVGLALWGAALREILGFAVLWLVLLAIESLNTAVEEVVDHLAPEWAQFAKHAKDLGSFAVACLIAANAIYVLMVLLGV
ncbi:diacylglycerol kinase [Gemmobacter denitrificans]|uniref:Diacylglycerol kinase n=1 Tax=Gemmobacter denitrificans TaxID=3123040 RepID=A0ABU8BTL7_9RHOB